MSVQTVILFFAVMLVTHVCRIILGHFASPYFREETSEQLLQRLGRSMLNPFEMDYYEMQVRCKYYRAQARYYNIKITKNSFPQFCKPEYREAAKNRSPFQGLVIMVILISFILTLDIMCQWIAHHINIHNHYHHHLAAHQRQVEQFRRENLAAGG